MDLLLILYYAIILLISYTLTKTLILNKLRNLPPNPFPTLPIIGHLHLLRQKKSDSNPIHRTLSQISTRYGPIVFLHLGSRPTLLVSSASAAEDCLHHNDVIFTNRPCLVGAKILAYNYTNFLWAPYGSLWRTHRRIASTEILSPHRISLLAHIRADEVSRLIKGIYVKGRDQIVDVKTMFVELTNNNIMRTIAGKRIHGEEEGSEFSIRFKTILSGLSASGGMFTVVDFLPWLKWFGVEKLAERKWMKIFANLDKFLQDLVEETRKGMEKEGESEGQNRNLIQVLLELKKTNPDYATDTIIKGMVETLLLAGTETSASTLEWAIALLIRNPHVHQKAKKEIDAYVGYDRLIEEADLEHIPYIHYIINETLRIYPAAPLLLPHESTDDCVVGGYQIPKGTMLVVNIWAIHNDPNVWDEPLVFKPERFEGVTGDRIGYKFMPFGSGRRACPGDHLATRLIGLTLASVIQCFEFEAQEFDMKEGVGVSVMRKNNSLKAMFRPRKELVPVLTQISRLA